MIRLRWLKMKAFRSFAEEVRIDFPESGLVLVRGANGAGKSSIMLAISYALDMCPFPATELQSWLTEDDLQVQVGFDSPQGPVVLARGKRNSLKIGEQPAITGAKGIAEGLKKLFGLDTEMLRAITYRPQDARGLFLSLGDSGKKEFLTGVLGLSSFEKAVEASEKQVKLLTPLLAQEESQAASAEAELRVLRAQPLPEVKDYGDLTQELQQRLQQLADLDGKIRELREAAEVKAAVASQAPSLVEARANLEMLAAKGQEVAQSDKVRQQQFMADRERLQQELRQQLVQQQQRLSLQTKIAEAQKALAHALQGKCPTCFRTWEESQKRAQELQSSIASMEASLLPAPSTFHQDLEARLREPFIPNPILSHFRDLQVRLETEYQQLKKDAAAAPELEYQAAVAGIAPERQRVVTRIAELTASIEANHSANLKLEQARTSVMATIASREAAVKLHGEKAAAYRLELNAERDLLAVLGNEGFLGVIFDDVLREIETEANERLARLANVSHVTIHFKTEVETQKGTVNKKIVPVVSISGVEAPLRSGLSGGMYTSVEGVVDLAVMSVVQRRTGTLPGFLFLDESFNGQGKETKEAVMEVLREYGQEKLVMVIDHGSEFKEMFTQFVDVTQTNGYSKVS